MISPSHDEKRGVSGIFRAAASPAPGALLWIGFIVLQAVHLVAALVAPHSLWGASQLRHAGTVSHVVCALILLIVLVPGGQLLLARGAGVIVNRLGRGPALPAMGGLAFAALLFYLFRTDNPFLGDSFLLTSLVSGPGLPDFGSAGFGSLWLHKLIFRMAGILPGTGNLSGEIPYLITSISSGALSIYLAARLSRLLLEGEAARAILFIVLAGSGGALFYMGYVEHYPLMQAALLAYLFLSIRHIRGEGSLGPPTVAIVAACAIHISAVVILPSWILLLSKGSLPPRDRLKWLLPILLPAVAGALLLFRYSERFYGGLEAFIPLLQKGSHSYAFTDIQHFSFVGNELLLLMGGALLLFCLNLPRRPEPEECEDNRPGTMRFLAVTSFLGLLFLVTVDPRLGPRDWDLMALPLYPLILLVAMVTLSRRENPSSRVAGMIVAAVLLHTVPWLSANRSIDRAVGMTLDMVVHDPHYANPAARAPKSLGILLSRAGYHEEAGKLYELAAETKEDAQNYFNLGTNFARRGEYGKAVDYLFRAIEIEPSYLEAYTNLAGALVELDRQDEGEIALRELIRIAPDYYRGRTALADLLNSAGRTDEAIVQYESAIAIDSTSAGAWANLGVARIRAGDREGARAAFLRAQALDPDNRQLVEYLRRLEG